MSEVTPIEYGRLPSSTARRDYPELWATVERDFPELGDFLKARIVSLVTGVCHHCYREASGCQCWNDE
jgi:hypothetical protein